MNQSSQSSFRGTTIVAVRHKGQVAIGGDGQVTLNDTVIKASAKKIRTLGDGSVLAGFAGSTADAFTLFERFEARLAERSGGLTRAAVALAKEWRSDKVLRHLEAMLLVADAEHLLLITGRGDVLEPDGDLVAIGSGGGYARAAAQALINHSDLDAASIVREALGIAAQQCIYTNDVIELRTIDAEVRS